MRGKRSRRGYVLMVVLGALAALSVLGGVVWVRLSQEREGRRAEAWRTQALWLARSAAEDGRPGAWMVKVGREAVRVSTRVERAGAGTRVVAEATLAARGSARVAVVRDGAGKKVDWQESYERVGPPRAASR